MSNYEFWDELGKIFNAVMAYQEKTIEFNKRFINPWIRLGNVFDKQDRNKEAVSAYEQAIELDPDNAQNWYELGNVYFKMERYDDAIDAYNKAMELDPDFGWSYSNLALTLVTQGKHVQAIPLYRRSIELLEEDEDKAVAWNRLGNLYRKLNEYDLAVEAFQRADDLDQENAGFRDNLDEAPEAPTVVEAGNGEGSDQAAVLNVSPIELIFADQQSTEPAPVDDGQPDDTPLAASTDVTTQHAQAAVDESAETDVVPDAATAHPESEPPVDVVAQAADSAPVDAPAAPAAEADQSPIADATLETSPTQAEATAGVPADDTSQTAPIAEVVAAPVAEKDASDVSDNLTPTQAGSTANEQPAAAAGPVSSEPVPSSTDAAPLVEPVAEVPAAAPAVEPAESAVSPAEETVSVVVQDTIETFTETVTVTDTSTETTDAGLTSDATVPASEIADAPSGEAAAETVAVVSEEAGAADDSPSTPEVTAVVSVDAATGIDTVSADNVQEPVISESTSDEPAAPDIIAAAEEIVAAAAEPDLQVAGADIPEQAAYEQFLKDTREPANLLDPQTAESPTETDDSPATQEPVAKIDPSGELQIELDTKNAHVWNELGNVYFNTGAFDDAIIAYSKAIELDRWFAWPYSNLALAYVQKGRFVEAILLYQRSIELFTTEKDKAISWNRLGNVYRRLNDYENAIASYQRADELDPDNTTLSLQSRFSLLGSYAMEQKPTYVS